MSEDTCIDLQYACKDSWDQSDLEYVHEASDAKLPTKMFSFDIYLCCTHPLGLGGPIEREEGVGLNKLVIILITIYL